MAKKELSPSKRTAIKTIYEAFKILKEAGGKLSGREIIKRISETVSFTSEEKEILQKTGNVRWQSIFHFYSIDSIKAGFIRKDNGIWLLTPEGDAALKKYNPEELLEVTNQAYKKWHAKQKQTDLVIPIEAIPLEDSEEVEAQSQQAYIEELKTKALDGLNLYIRKKTPYEFQNLVAALLRGMGYYIPFIAPKGKDGGIDIIAYQDPLGVNVPRIKVQVKHKPDTAIPVDEIRSLVGVINKEGDVGLFVTSGRFTGEAERVARESRIHIELIDFEKFIELWRQFYNKLSDEDKNQLPLLPIYFLGTNE